MNARLDAVVRNPSATLKPSRPTEFAKVLDATEKRFENAAPSRSGDSPAGRQILRAEDEPLGDRPQRREGRTMNTAIIVSLLLCALPAGSMADKPKVTRTMLEAMEKSVDGKLQKLFSP